VDVDLAGLERADAVHFPALEHAQQLRLHRRGQLADFVEEQRPLVGELEQARLVVGRAGEGAAHVAEELAFEERLDDRRAVHGDEAAVAPRSDLMQRARHQLLAGPGLPRDERRADVRREPPDHAEQILHERTAADHPAELQPLGDIPFDRQQAAPPLDLVAHGGEQQLQPAEVERLAQVVHRAQLDRLHRGVDRGVAGHQHRLAVRIDLANGADDVEPADVRHAQIHHRDVRAPCLQLRDRVAAARTGDHVEPRAARKPGDHVENALLVVDHDERRPLPCHTHSLETARTAARMARNCNGGASTALARSRPKRSTSPSSADMEISTSGIPSPTQRELRHAARSAAIKARSTNAALSAVSRHTASASALEPAVTTSQPQPASAAAM
jgi:hypothetical protein